VAFAHGVAREYELRKHTYPHLRAEGLRAQGAGGATRVQESVRSAYTTLHANIRVRNLDKPKSKRLIKGVSKPITVRPDAAQ
jgi:hypothetical protein